MYSAAVPAVTGPCQFQLRVRLQTRCRECAASAARHLHSSLASHKTALVPLMVIVTPVCGRVHRNTIRGKGVFF